jgi:DNA-binding beta-propeller fold protein YncE
MTRNILKTLVFFGGAVIGLLSVLSILFWLGLIPGQVTFEHPFDVATAPDGRIVVADTLNNRLVILDATGNYISAFGSKGNGTGEFRSPMGVAVSDEGNIFVVDSWNNRIQVFEGNGTFIRSWGSEGFRDGELDSPRYIAITPDGDVVVTEADNRRIQIFDQNGTFKHTWGATAPFADAQRIYHAFNGYGAGRGEGGRWNLSTDGQVVSTWDSDDELDNYLFSFPDGVAVNRQGEIVFADINYNRLGSVENLSLPR